MLWDRGEGSVRDVYDAIRERLPIVQNTVQAFLRTDGAEGPRRASDRRSDVRVPACDPPASRLARRFSAECSNERFDGALDQLVESALSLRQPTDDELARLRKLLAEAEQSGGSSWTIWTEWWVENLEVVLGGATVILILGALLCLRTAAPIRRQRTAQWTVLTCLGWLAVTVAPIDRLEWSDRSSVGRTRVRAAVRQTHCRAPAVHADPGRVATAADGGASRPAGQRRSDASRAGGRPDLGGVAARRARCRQWG